MPSQIASQARLFRLNTQESAAAAQLDSGKFAKESKRAYSSQSMNAPSLPPRGAAQGPAIPMIRPAFRSPRRVTITIPYMTYQDLQERADGEGRSLSNLAAYLLESSLQESNEPGTQAPEARIPDKEQRPSQQSSRVAFS